MKKLILTLLCVFLVPSVGYASTGVGDGIVIEEQSSTPSTPESGKVHVYVDNTSTPVLKMVDDAGTVTSITAGSGDNTLDNAYDQGGAGAGKAITVDTGAIALSNTDADGNALLTINASPSSSAAAEGINITLGANATGASLEFENSGSGYDVEGTGALWYVTKAGSAYFTVLNAGSFTPGAFTGTGDITLDDGVTDAPSLVFTDATDESTTITKTDGSYTTITTVAADGVNILVGNLKIGNGSPGQTINGEDFYCEGISEFDGTATFDGAITANGAVSCVSTLALSENVTFTMAADEYMQLDAATTDMTGTQGALDINFDSTTTASSAINVKATLVNNTGSEEITGVFIDLDDDSDAAAELSGITIDATDTTGSSEIWGIAFQAADGSATGVEECIHAEPPAAGKYLVLDAVTVPSTQTAGVMDIDFATVTTAAMALNLKTTLAASAGAGVEVTGMYLDVEDDSDSASTVTGITIDSTDATGSSEVRGIAFETIAGADTLLDTCIYAETDADTVVLSVDATGTDHTGTSGVIDINYGTVTKLASALNIYTQVGDTQTTEGDFDISSIAIDLDDDTSTAAANIYGVNVTSEDGTGNAGTLNKAFMTRGCDVALQADNGYVRIGTGSTPGITPGDDDLFVEGTAEIDGELQTDGSIDVNGTIVGAGTSSTTMVGINGVVENYTGADNVITIAEAGTTYTNSGDADGSQHTLPEASTCIGAEFTFVVVAAQLMTIELDNADIIMHLTLDAGDPITSSTANDSITLRAISSSQWMVVSVYPTAADWADGG